MPIPQLEDHLFTLVTSADSYDLGVGQTFSLIGDINEDRIPDQVTYHYEQKGFRIEVAFGTPVCCGTSGYESPQSKFVPYDDDRLIYNAYLSQSLAFSPSVDRFHAKSAHRSKQDVLVDWNGILDRYPNLETFLIQYRNVNSWKFSKIFALLFRSQTFCEMFDKAMRASVKIVPRPQAEFGQGSYFSPSDNSIHLDFTDPMLAIISLLHEIAHYDDVLPTGDAKSQITKTIENEIASDIFATQVLKEIGLEPDPTIEFARTYVLLKDHKIAEAKEVKKYQLSSASGCTYLETAYLISLPQNANTQSKYAQIRADYQNLNTLMTTLVKLFDLAYKNSKTLDDILTAPSIKDLVKNFPQIQSMIIKYEPQFQSIDLAKLQNDRTTRIKFYQILKAFKAECIQSLVRTHAEKFGFTSLL